MPLNLYKLYCGDPLFSDSRIVVVAAPDAAAAINCMTHGSDSCWQTVARCDLLGPAPADLVTDKCYHNCGGWIVESE